MNIGEITLKLILAAILGGLIGFEREAHGRAAGFRTHIMVSLGSALFMIISLSIFERYRQIYGDAMGRIDPGRIAAQVVTGIGFLGAGTIIRFRGALKGLTTAACLWVVCGIGMAAGLGIFGPALMVTAISLATLFFMGKLEKVFSRDTYCMAYVTAQDQAGILEKLEEILDKNGVQIQRFSLEKDNATQELLVELNLKSKARKIKKLNQFIFEELTGLAGVKRVRLE